MGEAHARAVLSVPGAGASVTREQALQSLVTGRSVSGLAGRQDDEPLIEIATRPAPLTIYVALPSAVVITTSPGSGRNRGRQGFHGILYLSSTRPPARLDRR